MKTLDRRNLLRNSVLVAIGFATGATLVKRRRLLAEGKCVSKGICSGCDVYEDCSLPQALSRKDVLSKKS